MSTHPHFTFIVNPVAGRGKTVHMVEKLSAYLRDSSYPHTILSTDYPGNGTELARDASKKSDFVVAVGGDGTVNEVASGVVYSNAKLAVLSEGSGNDFARMVNAPSKIENIIDRYLAAEHKKFDAGKAIVTLSDGTVHERFFFNSIGLGFDAAVAKHVQQINWLRGIPLYMTALIQTLIGYHPHKFTVKSEKYSKTDSYFLVCVGNGEWEGGGFKVTPNALPDDGKFEVCCVRGKSVSNVLPILPYTLTGGHTKKKIVDIFETKMITVECEKPFPVHGDGEIFGTNVQKIEISIVPQSLNVVVSHRV